MKTADAIQKLDSIIDDLAGELDNGSTAGWLDYLNTASRFHSYSFSNQILIFCQRKNASHVAGFNTWKSLGRFVKKGAKGIAIIAPCSRTQTVTQTGENGNETSEEVKLRRFRVVYVFDVEDTELMEGAEEVELNWKKAIGHRGDGTPEQFAQLKAFAESIGIPVRFENTGSAGGFTNGKEIVLDRKCFGTLAHELGHVLCQFRTGRMANLTQEERELEAESVAYLVCSAMGIERNAQNYILNWKGDSKKLRAHADHIQKAAKEILSSILDADQSQAEAA